MSSSKGKRNSSLFKRNSLRFFGSVFSDSPNSSNGNSNNGGSSNLAPIPQHPESSRLASSKLSRKSSIASRLSSSGRSNADSKLTNKSSFVNLNGTCTIPQTSSTSIVTPLAVSNLSLNSDQGKRLSTKPLRRKPPPKSDDGTIIADYYGHQESAANPRGHIRTKSEIEELQDQVDALIQSNQKLDKIDTSVARNGSQYSTTQPPSLVYDDTPLDIQNSNLSAPLESRNNFSFVSSAKTGTDDSSVGLNVAEKSSKDDNSLQPVNSHQSFIDQARRSSENLDELINENHQRLKAEHDIIDKQLLLLSPKNRGAEEHEEYKRRSLLFHGQELDNQFDDTQLPENDDNLFENDDTFVKDTTLATVEPFPRNYQQPYPEHLDDSQLFGNPNSTFLSSSVNVDEFTDALENNNTTRETVPMPGGYVNSANKNSRLEPDEFNFVNTALSPPSPNVQRSRGTSVGQYSNADTYQGNNYNSSLIDDSNYPIDDSNYPIDNSNYPINDSNDPIDSYSNENQFNHQHDLPLNEELNAVNDYSPFHPDPSLTHAPTMQSVTNSTISTGPDDELNFVPRSQVYSPYGLEDTVRPRKMVVANNVTDDENTDEENVDDERDVTDTEVNQYTPEPSLREFSSESGFSPARSFGSPITSTAWSSQNGKSYHNQQMDLNKPQEPYYERKDRVISSEIRGGSKISSGLPTRLSNPHLPKSVYEPIEKLARLEVKKPIPSKNNYPGFGEKCSYVEIIRQRTMCANTTTENRKWNLPVGIRPIDQKSMRRKSGALLPALKHRLGYRNDIKHVSLQPRLLATGDDEDDTAGEGTILAQNEPARNRISFDGSALNVKSSSDKDVVPTRNTSSDEDDDDLFAEFADDINQVNATTTNTSVPTSNNLSVHNDSDSQKNSPNSSVNYEGTPTTPSLNRFESVRSGNIATSSGYGMGGGLFVANPDTDSD